MRLVVLGLALALPSAALACPGRSATASAAETEQPTVASVDAASCAKRAELVGSACSYTTGMMAQRILTDGADFSFTGTLAATSNDLESHVAAPYTLANGAVHVVANEVLDAVPAASRLTLTGKKLDVNGVSYFVVTSFADASQS